MNKIGIVLGTRPEIIKLSPIIRLLDKKKENFFIIHTNQHYSSNMDEIFFKELNLPCPKYNLNTGSGSHAVTTAKMLIDIEKILIKEKPEWLIVQGDTNSVMSGALAASKINVKVAHVEAGLRSYDKKMPEEINRIVTDHISEILFCPTKKQYDILKKENIMPDKIHITGNTIVDAVLENISIINQKKLYQQYKKQKYFLLTTHRPSNVDNKDSLQSIIDACTFLSIKYKCPVIFPIHPRTEKQLKMFGIKIKTKHIRIIEPVGYLEMLTLQKNARLILTDSGGIQEEACILNTPSVTLRDNTERPETIEVKASILSGNKKTSIIKKAETMLSSNTKWKNPFGDGNSAKTIIDLLGK